MRVAAHEVCVRTVLTMELSRALCREHGVERAVNMARAKGTVNGVIDYEIMMIMLPYAVDGFRLRTAYARRSSHACCERWRAANGPWL